MFSYIKPSKSEHPMTRLVAGCIILFCLAAVAQAQPELYADPFLGYPEFRALILRLPAENPDSVVMQINVRILYDDLQFIKDGDQYAAGYGLDVALLLNKDKVVSSRHQDRKLSVSNYTKTNSRSSGDQTSTIFTEIPRSYVLRVALTDRESQKTRTLEKEITFPEDEWQPDLRLGDIALLDSTGAIQMTSGYLNTHPLHACLQLFSRNPAAFSAEYRLQDDEDRVFASGKLPWDTTRTLRVDTVALPIDSLPAGQYHFIALARVGEQKILRVYPFKILRQELPEFIQDIDEAIAVLHYVANDEEIAELENAPGWQRQEMLMEFWKKRDDTPKTQRNERMEEYYRRVGFANKEFSGSQPGWMSDMGRVYIIYGAPTDIERHPFDRDKRAYEIWIYYDLNRSFLFVDQNGLGDYKLRTPALHEY
jgi:GWxTD domain-containing protein